MSVVNCVDIISFKVKNNPWTQTQEDKPQICMWGGTERVTGSARHLSDLPVIWICSTFAITESPDATWNIKKKMQNQTINLSRNSDSQPLMRCCFNKRACWTTEPFGKHCCSFACWHRSSERAHMDPAEPGCFLRPERVGVAGKSAAGSHRWSELFFCSNQLWKDRKTRL